MNEKSQTGQHLANVTLAGWLAADAVRVALFVHDLATELVDVVAGVLFAITAIFVLRRTRPLGQDTRPASVAVALAATVLPALLAWLAPAQRTTSYLLVAQGAAVVLMGAGLLYLGRNFSILPQYRRVITDGPYAVVRHPIYGSYLIFDGVLAFEAQSWLAGVLWFAECALLTARAQLEERLLAVSDTTYRQYLARVRWRFMPGVM